MNDVIKDEVKKFLPFTDKERGIFQYYFKDYVKVHEKELTKLECFELAILSADLQYQLRYLTRRIRKELPEINIDKNDKYFQLLCEYDCLIDFIIKKIKEDFFNKKEEYIYKYKQEYKNSYFNNTEERNLELQKNIELL